MAKALQVVFSFIDNKGKRASTAINTPTGLTFAGAIEFAQDVAVLIDAVTDCAVTAVNITQPVDISGLGLAASALATADVEEKGVFQYTTDGGFKTSVAIPGWADAMVVDGSDAIDLTDGDVIAFNSLMIDGITPAVYGVLIEPSDTREDDIAALDYARERFRASGKRV